jgi:hypothetical protein
MTRNDKHIPNDSLSPDNQDRLFDRLVDDELTDTERKELLSGLDSREGGWRRCAIAFLEAQSWRREIGSLFGKSESDKQNNPSQKSELPKTAPRKESGKTRKTKKRRSLSGPLLSVAAGILLAIGMNSLIQEMGMNSSPGLPPFSGNQFASMINNQSLPQKAGLGSLDLSIDPRKDVHLVKLNGRTPSGKQLSAVLPAISQDRLDETWIKNMPSAIPDELVNRYQQAGHEIKTTRQLLPIRMGDGRKLIIAVDQLDVRYTDQPAYQ